MYTIDINLFCGEVEHLLQDVVDYLKKHHKKINQDPSGEVQALFHRHFKRCVSVKKNTQSEKYHVFEDPGPCLKIVTKKYVLLGNSLLTPE